MYDQPTQVTMKQYPLSLALVADAHRVVVGVLHAHHDHLQVLSGRPPHSAGEVTHARLSRRLAGCPPQGQLDVGLRTHIRLGLGVAQEQPEPHRQGDFQQHYGLCDFNLAYLIEHDARGTVHKTSHTTQYILVINLQHHSMYD